MNRSSSSSEEENPQFSSFLLHTYTATLHGGVSGLRETRKRQWQPSFNRPWNNVKCAFVDLLPLFLQNYTQASAQHPPRQGYHHFPSSMSPTMKKTSASSACSLVLCSRLDVNAPHERVSRRVKLWRREIYSAPLYHSLRPRRKESGWNNYIIINQLWMSVASLHIRVRTYIQPKLVQQQPRVSSTWTGDGLKGVEKEALSLSVWRYVEKAGGCRFGRLINHKDKNKSILGWDTWIVSLMPGTAKRHKQCPYRRRVVLSTSPVEHPTPDVGCVLFLPSSPRPSKRTEWCSTLGSLATSWWLIGGEDCFL